jgi:hypothetical protein
LCLFLLTITFSGGYLAAGSAVYHSLVLTQQ